MNLAKLMLTEGKPVDKIIKYTGLTLEQLEQIEQ